MHIEALKTFCDLVETQSFSFTAERNFVSQPAVSQQLRSLENKFTRRLLERGHGRNKIHLTSEGEIFYRECKHILANYAALHEEIYERVGLVNTTRQSRRRFLGRSSQTAAENARVYEEVPAGKN